MTGTWQRDTVCPMQVFIGADPNAVSVTAIIPVLAAFVMAGVESLVESLGWKQRLVKTGWDLCVLAVGSVAGIFAVPNVVGLLGPRAVIDATVSCLLSLIAGVLIMHIRKTKAIELKGWHGFVALGLGGGALIFPWYVVLHLRK